MNVMEREKKHAKVKNVEIGGDLNSKRQKKKAILLTN